ncbi:hypothetical protein G9A89_002754 [Geosiphon pyriformis]|nr:hypothetical protein G9A89_002754 [Geosiphon pyriformis]
MSRISLLLSSSSSSSSRIYYSFSSLASLLLLLLFQLIVLPKPKIHAQCFDYNPLNFRDRTPVVCPWVKNESPSLQKREIDSKNMLQITFTCGINDQEKCNKVQRAFTTAGGIITATLMLHVPILVNATFLNFCDAKSSVVVNTGPAGSCGGSNVGSLTIGGAAPTRTIPMQDEDGKERLYPQSLVKQFNFTKHRAYAGFDITAQFNAIADFWFDDDSYPIGPNQADFLRLILHELMHGLGFISSWDDYLNRTPQALTPELNPDPVDFQFKFIEYAFDQYMVIIPQSEKASAYTDIQNSFADRVRFAFNTLEGFTAAFFQSPEYQSAKKMFQFGITPKNLGFLPKGNSEVVLLETSLNPYQLGSSISHVDFETYGGTSDFLMRYSQDPGVSLQDAILMGGNYSGGPIGPKLRLILETLG